MNGDLDITEAVASALKIDSRGYMPFVVLGMDRVERGNRLQALLCFEQALMYCDSAEDRAEVQGYMQKITSGGGRKQQQQRALPAACSGRYRLVQSTGDVTSLHREHIPHGACGVA